MRPYIHGEPCSNKEFTTAYAKENAAQMSEEPGINARDIISRLHVDKGYWEELTMEIVRIVDNFGHLEKEDLETFEHIEEEIDQGGMIFIAG